MAVTNDQEGATGVEGTPLASQAGPGGGSAGSPRNPSAPAPLAFAVLLMALGLAVYSNVLRNGIFIFDDMEYILENTIIRDLSQTLGMADPRQMGYLSFALNLALDPGWHPFGFHLVNIVIHVLTAVMVYFSARTLSVFLDQGPRGSEPGDRPNASTPADFIPAMAALLFLVHPVQTQAVSYVTQRFTSLSTFFYMAAVLSYLTFRARVERSEQGNGAFWLLGLALASTVFAMRTKEISFTLPFLMAGFELLVFRGSVLAMRRFFILIPFLATLVIIPVSLAGPDFGIAGYGAGVDEITRKEKLYDLFERSAAEYLVTQFRVVTTYLRLLLLPVNQLAVYDLRASRSVFEPGVVASLLVHAALAGSAVLAWRKAHYAGRPDASSLRLFSIGILWFYLTLSVESSIIPIKDLIFEHRVYLPSVGFLLALSVLCERGTRPLFPAVSPELRAAVLAGILILPLSVATFSRNMTWTDEVRFWDDVVRKTGKAIGYNNRGNAYLKSGQFELALVDFNATISFFPGVTDRMAWENSDFSAVNIGKTYLARAEVYRALGRAELASADAQTADFFMTIAKQGRDRP